MGIDCKAKTLFDKVWEKHVITGEPGEAQLLYIDLHLNLNY